MTIPFPFLRNEVFEKFKENNLNVLDIIGRNVGNYNDTLEECLKLNLNITNKIHGVNSEDFNNEYAKNNYNNDNLTNYLQKIYENIIEFINIPIIRNINEIDCDLDSIKKINKTKYDIIVFEQILHLNIDYNVIKHILENLTNDGCII